MLWMSSTVIGDPGSKLVPHQNPGDSAISASRSSISALPLFAIAILVVGVWSIRSGLHPLRSVAARAATIAPEPTGVRLNDARLPNELQPLVAAFNRALDRLERGLTSQREFTANAAHQFRTPLAILTAQLDELPGSAPIA